jgi:hypothetical protein
MSRRYLILLLIIFGVSLYRIVVPESHPPSISPIEVARLLREGDAESRLALGEPLELSTASIYDLELIAGISDTMATRIMEKKGEILLQASLLPPERRWLALTLVHGIGPKKGAHLARFIAFN